MADHEASVTMFIETIRGDFVAASEIYEIRVKEGQDSFTAFLRDGSTRSISAEEVGSLARIGRVLPARPGDTAVVCTTWDEDDGSIGCGVHEVAIVGWRIRGGPEAGYGEPILAEESWGGPHWHVGILRSDGRIYVQHDDEYRGRDAFIAAAVKWHEDLRKVRAPEVER